MHQQNLHPLTLYQALHVRQYAKDHVLYGALLLEDHACQIEQHLIALDFQLRFLKQLRIAQSDATELQIRGEDLQRRRDEGLLLYCAASVVKRLMWQIKIHKENPFPLPHTDTHTHTRMG